MWNEATDSRPLSASRYVSRQLGHRDASITLRVPAARRAHMLAQELPGLRRQQPDVQIIPLHLEAVTDPAGRRTVVRRLDFHAAIEVHGPFAVAVIAKRFERQRPERGSLLGKHLGEPRIKSQRSQECLANLDAHRVAYNPL